MKGGKITERITSCFRLRSGVTATIQWGIFPQAGLFAGVCRTVFDTSRGFAICPCILRPSTAFLPSRTITSGTDFSGRFK